MTLSIMWHVFVIVVVHFPWQLAVAQPRRGQSFVQTSKSIDKQAKIVKDNPVCFIFASCSGECNHFSESDVTLNHNNNFSRWRKNAFLTRGHPGVILMRWREIIALTVTQLDNMSNVRVMTFKTALEFYRSVRTYHKISKHNVSNRTSHKFSQNCLRVLSLPATEHWRRFS